MTKKYAVAVPTFSRMLDDSSGPRLSRRSVLRNGAVAAGALTLGAATASASSGTITLEAWFGGAANYSHYDDHFKPAAREIASQTSVGVEFDGGHATGNHYSGSYGDIFDQFRDNHGDEFDDGKIHVLFHDQPPDRGAPAVHADGASHSDTRPVAVVNQWTNFPGIDPEAYPNTILTGILRPLLTPHADEAPASGDVNSFGTQYEGLIPIVDTYVSPLATWHTPSGAVCQNPGDIEGTSDNVDALCGGDDPRPNCQCSTDLSDCTVEWVERHVEDYY